MLIESITLAQRDNKELEALIYRFRPLIRKCGRQLHIEDGEQEMVVAFIELIKRFRPERLRSQDDGKVVQYIKNAMNYSYLCLSNSKVLRFARVTAMRTLLGCIPKSLAILE